MVDRECIDMCPGWGPRDLARDSALDGGGVRSMVPSPLTIVFGGNGAGKSAVFDAVLFVLGQVNG